MNIYSVLDPEFISYGKVLEGYDTSCLLKAMEAIPLPEAGVAYEPSIPTLEATCAYGQFQNNAYGGMPVQIGMCWGRNTRLNCLEYHRDSEVNIGTGDFILLLAKQDEIMEAEGFRVAVVLPRGTNTASPGAAPLNQEDKWLTARNKWLLAHPESNEAAQGAHIGLKGVNIDLASNI